MRPDWGRNDVAAGKTVVSAIDVHAAGEPLRIITGRHEFIIHPDDELGKGFSL